MEEKKNEKEFHKYMAENTGKDVKIQRSGFWINHLYPEHGCSPDCLAYNNKFKIQ